MEDKSLKNVLDFYLKTSMYTYLGPYVEFTKLLPDNIEELCALQKCQTIHPQIFDKRQIYEDKDNFYGDMSKIPLSKLKCEEDILPTALSILSELLRRDPVYSINRNAENKVHILCRGNSILLCAILKSKGIPSRVRTGFSKYHYITGLCDDQWNTEYYDFKLNRWKIADSSGIDLCESLNIDMTDIPNEYFIKASDAWLNLRENKFDKKIKLYNNDGHNGLEAAWMGLMNDFNCIMNNEIPVTFEPQYLYVYEDGKLVMRGFTQKELEELDLIAKLMQDIEKNFDKLKYIYNTKLKFQKMIGNSTWNMP